MPLVKLSSGKLAQFDPTRDEEGNLFVRIFGVGSKLTSVERMECAMEARSLGLQPLFEE